MHQRKSKKLLFYFFLLIITSSISNISLNNLKFDKFLSINISGLTQKDNLALRRKVERLNVKNIFFMNKKDISEIFSSNSLIERYEIFLKYPYTIDIKIVKTNFLAKINRNGKIFLIGSNGKLISYKLDNIDIPFIFGIPQVSEFLKFKNILDSSKFSYEQIENLYFFPSKRWDIEFRNKIILKLPRENVRNALDDVFKFFKNSNMNNIKTIDVRVKNQIILND